MRRPSSHTALLAGRRRRGPSRARWAACAAACFGAGLLLSLARGGGSVHSVGPTPPQHATLEVVEREAGPAAAAAAVGAAAASAVATTSTTPPAPNKLRAHLVVYSHVDPGWLRTVDGYWEAGYKAGQNGVKNLIDGAVRALAAAPPSSNRSYTWGEAIYLERWWRQADDTAKAALKAAVADGRFAFAGGGWVSPDEATAHAVDMVDALAIGHDWLWRTFQVGPPTAAWQIDTFGHSAAHTALVHAAGADAIFFSRIDTEDRLHREAAKQLEFVWDSAPGAARGADVWCYAFYGGIYDIPPTIEALQHAVPSDPAAADAEWAARLANVSDYIKTVAARSRGDGPVMISIARDFGWDDIGLLYDNLDELIKRAAAAGIDISYSTAPRHAAARAADARAAWPVQQGDLFPYSDCKGCYWSGYFSTRPGTKRLVREASGVLAAARQADVWGRGVAAAAAAGPAEPVETLARAVALMQHHDAITGTDMAAVNADYRRIVAAAVAGGRRVIGSALDAKVFGGDVAARVKLGGRKVGPAGAAGAAATATATNDDTPVPTFTFCEAHNASVCAPAVALSDRLAPFTVAVASALPRARTAAIEVPLGAKAATVGWTAVAADDGARVRAQVVPTRADTRALHAHLVAVRAAGADDVAAATAVFEGRVPGMGYKVWTLVPDGDDVASAAAATTPPPPPPAATACSSFPSNCTDDGDAVTITNGVVTLTFSRAAGGLTTVASTHPSAPAHPVAVSPSLRRYTHRLDTSIAAWFLRRSGHYAFHPAGDAEPLATGPATLDVVAGPALTTVTRRYGGYASLTVRLRAGAVAPELEWTVGPLPSPQDVVLRLDTDLASEPGTLFTDANGREYVKRAKASRSTFVPAPIEPPYANPIGRDYYPTTVGAYVQAGDTQVSLLSDRPQGAASLAAGALEMMLHREAEACDELGNPEILAERIGGSPVVVRGVSVLAVTSIAGGPAVRRRLATEAYHPVHVAFSGRVLDGGRAASAAASLLSADLPPAVDLHKFGAASGGGGIDVRLAHAFDEGEDATASVPVSVDLKAAFASIPFKSAHETAITGVPLSALRGGKGAAVPAVHPRRGERIFAGPKFFDYDNLSAPGVDMPGASVTAPPLVPRPKKAAASGGGVDKVGRFKLAPLEVKSVRLAFGGEAKSV